MQTAFNFLSDVLKKEVGTSWVDWIKDNMEQNVWSCIRFVTGEREEPQTPNEAMTPDRSPVLDFVDRFSRYEKSIRTKIADEVGLEHFSGPTLDLVLKSPSNVDTPNDGLIKAIPIANRLRNQLVHGEGETSSAAVKTTLEALDQVIEAFRSVPSDVLKKAVEASEEGVRVTKLGLAD